VIAILVTLSILPPMSISVSGPITSADAVHSCGIRLIVLLHIELEPESLPLMVVRLLMLLLLRAPGTCRL